MPHLTDPNPTAPVVAVLIGHTGSAQTTTEVLAHGGFVCTTTYPDGSWVAVHGPGHPEPAVLAERTLPRGTRLASLVHIDGKPVPSQDRVLGAWTVRACEAGPWAVITRTPSSESGLPQVRLTAPAMSAPGEVVPCRHKPACPDHCATDAPAAIAVTSHAAQGWSLLCNGTLAFDDTKALLPDGRIIEPAAPGSSERAA
ncbi:DUF5999 family protein [Kitasatospora sp. NPDC059327]|uniref:DUF5999 family protein n=1 Tax=Kitasatospora sp. NPDC059327 TaxID=3346803 RepID=UPI003673E20E